MKAFEKSGEYFLIGNYVAIREHDGVEWRISRISYKSMREVVLTLVDVVYDKNTANQIMKEVD